MEERTTQIQAQRVDNLGIGTHIVDRRTDNPDISIVDANRETNNLGIDISIADTNGRSDNLGKSIKIVDIDGKINDPGPDTGIANRDKRVDIISTSIARKSEKARYKNSATTSNNKHE